MLYSFTHYAFLWLQHQTKRSYLVTLSTELSHKLWFGCPNQLEPAWFRETWHPFKPNWSNAVKQEAAKSGN